MEIRKYDIYCGIFWLLLGGSVCVMSLKDLGLGTLRYPAPGFYPFLISLLLICIALVLIIRAVNYRKKAPEFSKRPSFGWNVPITLGAMLVYAFVMDYLGYLISTSLLMLFFFKVTASLKWWVSLLLTAVTISISYYFFVVLLQSQLPAGILG